MTSDYKQNATLEWIRKYWVIIVFIFMSFAAWITLTNKVDSHSADIEALRATDTTNIAINNQILVKLSGIESDLFWLKNNLNK